MRPRSYVLTVGPEAAGALASLGVTDATLRPHDDLPPAATAAPHDAAAVIRAALMTVGSVSDPRRNPHLELRAPTAALAERLRGLIFAIGGTGARAAERADGWRVTCKSGAAIGAVLARAGAHASFLDWDAARMRRELRGDANRAANADRANVARAVSAAARQVATIEAAVAAQGWQALSDELRATALTRLANPAASLAELAALHDPPLTKATVHRRLARLERMARSDSEAGR
jgi:DNA-binding protein WhiA